MSDLGGNAAAQVRGFCERIERINEEIKGMTDDRKDIFSEAKAQGFDPKMLRYSIAMRKMEKEARAELLALQETYLAALGLA